MRNSYKNLEKCDFIGFKVLFVSFRPDDHHLITFFIPLARYYHKVAPQVCLASGDGVRGGMMKLYLKQLELQNALMTLFYGMRNWLIIGCVRLTI